MDDFLSTWKLLKIDFLSTRTLIDDFFPTGGLLKDDFHFTRTLIDDFSSTINLKYDVPFTSFFDDW